MTHCPRRLWYEKNPPDGIESLELDPFETLVAEMGLVHERAVRDRLASEMELVEAVSADHTRDLMDAGVPAIYQAELHDEANDLLGKPDFLLLQNDGSYRPADAKLARSLKREIGVQLAFYRRLLGTEHTGVVYLGDGNVVEVGEDYNPHLNTFIIEARSLLNDAERPEVFFSASKCNVCPFKAICVPEFEERDDLSLLYDLRSVSIPRLNGVGIETISDLAATDPTDIPENIPWLKGDRKERVVLQAQAVKQGTMFKRGEIALPEGTYVHFDIETNPLAPDGNEHVYLWGFLKPPYNEANFDAIWTDTHEDDRAGWDAFLGMVEAYRDEWPNLKLVHFSNYERRMIRDYAQRYDMEEHPTVAWLLDSDGPLYDIQDAVTDNLVLPLSGYGLKAIAKHPDLVNFQWEDTESGSQWSVVQYVNFLNATDEGEREALKASILGYNRDDVMATYMLEQWLRTL